MSWQDDYRRKLKTADEALSVLRSSQRVWVQQGNSTPQPLLDAMIRRAPALKDVEVISMLTLGDAPYTRPEFAGTFRHGGLFLGGNVREAVQAGRADYTPIFLSEIEGLFLSGEMPLDVVLMQVAPPDEHGYLSMGTCVDCTLTAARTGKVVIAEVNARMPRTYGDCVLHVSEIDMLVETSRPLLALPQEVYNDESHHRIAEHVAELVPDGATLQLGIGGIPEAVLGCLGNHRDLGLHSELLSDAIIPLIENGVINGRLKTLHRGKAVVGFILGTQVLIDYLRDNYFFELHPISYTNDPFVIAQNDRMVAINSAIQVDITGQVCADSIGTRPYSGVGGQPDFIRGAARSKGGKPIIALPSTAKHGTISRIA
ncbi:MAG: acetyl-CoA hydrolase/transferase C-terminal domain-containing protein, partial [Bryobacteraceae bacterium]|nr:acetyl-CoA hydrolase/transferase C-terminal domain-containing protein [Bryobacteraceae bacterium]